MSTLVATLQQGKRTRNEREHNKLMLRPDGNRLAFQGGIPVLTPEMGMELCPLYLDEIGRHTFLRKIEEEDFQAEDIDHMAQFLMHHGVQPSAENCFRLLMGARIDMIFAAR